MRVAGIQMSRLHLGIVYCPERAVRRTRQPGLLYLPQPETPPANTGRNRQQALPRPTQLGSNVPLLQRDGVQLQVKLFTDLALKRRLPGRLKWVLLDIRADVPRGAPPSETRHVGMSTEVLKEVVNVLHPSPDLRLYLQADVVLAWHIDVQFLDEVGLHGRTLGRQRIVFVPRQP
eukprot:3941131-Rhodomonas_salina.2